MKQRKLKQRNQQYEQKGHFGTVALVYLLQDTERTIIPYLNKKETLEGLLNDGYRTWPLGLFGNSFCIL